MRDAGDARRTQIGRAAPLARRRRLRFREARAEDPELLLAHHEPLGGRARPRLPRQLGAILERLLDLGEIGEPDEAVAVASERVRLVVRLVGVTRLDEVRGDRDLAVDAEHQIRQIPAHLLILLRCAPCRNLALCVRRAAPRFAARAGCRRPPCACS